MIDPVELAVVDGLPERPTVIDVGACRGDFTAAVLERRPHATVVACEANPALHRALVRRFARSRVAVVGAMGAEVGTMTLHTHPRSPELGTLHPRPWMPEVDLPERAEVPVGTIDALRLGHVDLLKVDAEGHEPEVLHGAIGTLARTDVVMFEWLAGASRYRDGWALRYIIDRLRDFEVADAHGSADIPDEGMSVCVARRRL